MYPFLKKNFVYLLDKHKTNPSRLSKEIKASQPTLYRIEKMEDGSEYTPDAKTIDIIAKWAGVDSDVLTKQDLELLETRQSKFKNTDPLEFLKKKGVEVKDFAVSELETKIYEDYNQVPDGYVAIDFYSEIKASAGNGYSNIEHISPKKIFIPFSEALKYDANPETSKTFIVDGESMLPELKPGFPVTIDTSAKRIIDGEIYAFLKGDELKIKILHTWNDEGQGGFIAKSSNPDKNRYPDEYYSPSRIELDDIQILGQFWLKLAGTKVKR